MERDMIDNFISILMIGCLLFLAKLIGYFIERRIKNGNTQKVIAGKTYDCFSDTPEELCIGGKKLILSQMETIIHECKHNHKRIVFIDGSTKFFGKIYASYGNNVLRYETGNEAIIE